MESGLKDLKDFKDLKSLKSLRFRKVDYSEFSLTINAHKNRIKYCFYGFLIIKDVLRRRLMMGSLLFFHKLGYFTKFCSLFIRIGYFQ